MSELKKLIDNAEKDVKKKPLQVKIKKEYKIFQDILLHICSFLTYQEILIMKLTCTQWFNFTKNIKVDVRKKDINVWLPKAINVYHLFENDLYFPSEFHSDVSLVYGANIFPKLEAVTLFLQCKFTDAAMSYFFKKLSNLKFVKLSAYKKEPTINFEDYKESLKILSKSKVLHGLKIINENDTIIQLVEGFGFKHCKSCGNFYLEENGSECLYHPGEYIGYGISASIFDCCGSMSYHYPGTPGCQRRKHSNEKIEKIGDYNVKLWNTTYNREKIEELFVTNGHEPFHVYPTTKEVLKKIF